MPSAQFPPSQFVNQLINPGLTVRGHPDPVALRTYLCANPSNGGNLNALRLMSAVRAVVRDTPDEQLIAEMEDGFVKVFTGQGKPEIVVRLMAIIWRRRADFAAYVDRSNRPVLQHFFTQANPLQAMVNDHMFGLDCVGFVGRYLQAAGVFRGCHS